MQQNIYFDKDINFVNEHITNNVYVITDRNVYFYYKNEINKIKNIKAIKILTPGENSKSMDTYNSVLEDLIAHKINKNDTIVAFGGGVVSDIAGFVSATYKRGLDYIIIGTSILSLDAAVGGKCALNTSSVKNSVGTFKIPTLTLFNTTYFETLSKESYIDGMAEVLKTLILMNDLDAQRDLLLNFDISNSKQYFSKVVEFKQKLCETDPYDKNERKILNFGHTLAHAIEILSNYEVSHGEAVANGIVFALYLSSEYRNNSIDYIRFYEKLKESGYNFYRYNVEDIIELMLQDKKNISQNVSFIVINNNKCIIREYTIIELVSKLNSYFEAISKL